MLATFVSANLERKDFRSKPSAKSQVKGNVTHGTLVNVARNTILRAVGRTLSTLVASWAVIARILTFHRLVGAWLARLAYFVRLIVSGVTDGDIAHGGRCGTGPSGGVSRGTRDAGDLRVVRSVLTFVARHALTADGHLLTGSAFGASDAPGSRCLPRRTCDALGLPCGGVPRSDRTGVAVAAGFVQEFAGITPLVAQVAGGSADAWSCLRGRTRGAVGLSLHRRVCSFGTGRAGRIVGIFVIVPHIASHCKVKRQL